MATTVIYYVDQNGNYYINSNNDFYIAKEIYDSAPVASHYLKYRPYIYKDGEFKTYTAYIRQSDGNYLKLIPHVYTEINIAIAGLAVAGVSCVSDKK